MKVRMNYVSNSSSSSYVIAYDKNFFNDLKELIKNTDYIGKIEMIGLQFVSLYFD